MLGRLSPSGCWLKGEDSENLEEGELKLERANVPGLLHRNHHIPHTSTPADPFWTVTRTVHFVGSND